MVVCQESYRQLAAAILHQAVKDTGEVRYWPDCADFFCGVNRKGGVGEWFFGLCFFLDLDPAAFMERLGRKVAV